MSSSVALRGPIAPLRLIGIETPGPPRLADSRGSVAPMVMSGTVIGPIPIVGLCGSSIGPRTAVRPDVATRTVRFSSGSASSPGISAIVKPDLS
jgi:hypothetical protein